MVISVHAIRIMSDPDFLTFSHVFSGRNLLALYTYNGQRILYTRIY
jgi:hypothetical protein